MRLLLLLAFGCASVSEPGPVDRDGDGFTDDIDCDDDDPLVYPGAPERCNGRDDDCDGVVDEDPIDALPFWPDRDGDGYGDGLAPSVRACEAPDGYVRHPLGDCDDGDPSVNPGVVLDICNGVDDDCDGIIDEDPDILRYEDRDGDGFGAAEVYTCDPGGTSEVGGDCDDDDPDVFPGADEVCNGRDDDCDGLVDNDAVDAGIWYPDADGDGFGADLPFHGCHPGHGWVDRAGDCDDWDAFTHPGARLICDGRDNACDGQLDPPDAWLGPDWPHRVPITVPSGAAPGLVFAEIDAGAFDPSSLRLVRQDCGGDGLVDYPVQWVDGLFSGGAVAFVIPDGDRAAANAQPVSFALYVGGPASPASGGPEVTSGRLATEHAVATFDDGLLALTLPGSPVLWAQDTGPAVSTPDGWRVADVVDQAVIADGPVLGALRVTSVGDGFDARTTWWMARGRPELWVRLDMTAEDDLGWSHPDGMPIAPFSATWPGLSDPAVTPGEGVDGGVWGVGWRPLTSPGHASWACDEGGCVWSAHDPTLTGSEGVIPAETTLLDAVLVIRAWGGEDPGPPDSPPEVVVGPGEPF